MLDLFIATISEESHRAFLLNSRLLTVLRLVDQEEALASNKASQSLSVDTAYPLSQILAVFGAGRSIFASTIPPKYSYCK